MFTPRPDSTSWSWTVRIELQLVTASDLSPKFSDEMELASGGWVEERRLADILEKAEDPSVSF
jgi:hypothetical protein